MDKKLVSVIIPTFSRPENLIRAISSVKNQTYSPIEIIIVDDNGENTPNQLMTYELLKNFIDCGEIKYCVHKKNANGSAARNTGFRASRGEYVNFLDDDDEFGCNKIERQVEYLNNNQEIDATYCDTIIKNGSKETTIINNDNISKIENILLEKLFFNTSTVLFRRNVIEELCGFDENFQRHQDYELYIRYFRNHKMKKTDCDLLIKYNTPNIVSTNPQKSIQYLEKLLSTYNDDLIKIPNYKKIYQYRYWSLVEYFLNRRYYKEAIYCIRQSLKYCLPSLKQFLYGIAFLIYPYYQLIKNKLFHRKVKESESNC